tara:strand:- start:233 stop:478 length:246 start_codon:yes stop_codon:yes gene_type:complete
VGAAIAYAIYVFLTKSSDNGGTDGKESEDFFIEDGNREPIRPSEDSPLVFFPMIVAREAEASFDAITSDDLEVPITVRSIK